MGKKGFTLAEILGVIVIISLLLVLVVPTIINNISSNSDDAKNTENEFIYNAVDLYIRENPDKYPTDKSGKYCIPIKDLIDEGKLVEPVKDVVTGEDLSDKSVLVTIYSTGTKEYEIKGAECSDLAALPMIDFLVEPTGSSWVKQRTVTIIYPTIEGKYQARYRREDLNSNKWQNDSEYNNGGTHTLIFDKSSKSTILEAQLKGKQIISGKFNVVNVDSDLPTIKKFNIGKWSDNYKKVGIVANDKTSGLNGIIFTTSSSKPSETQSGWINFSSDGGDDKTYIKEFSNGTYYVWVKDKAGNISNRDSSNKNSITFKDRTYHPGYYYCPSGYTSSGSGSSMSCSKTEKTTRSYQSSYYSCPSGYSLSGSICIGPWTYVVGTNWCKDGVYVDRTHLQDMWDECDNSRYQANGSCTDQPVGDYQFHPTTYCRMKPNAKYHSGYYYCESGYTLSGTECVKTVTTSPNYSPAYYDCSSGYTMVGDTCYKIS